MGIALTARDGKTKMEAVLLSASGSQEELTCGELEIPWAQLRRSREHAEGLATSGHTAQSREREKYPGIFFSCHCLPLTGPRWKRDLRLQPLVFRPEQEYAESGSEDREANVSHIQDLVQTQKAHQEFEEY